METGNLRNEDFRKLLTQKREAAAPVKAGGEGGGGARTASKGGAAFSHKQAAKQQQPKKKGGAGHKYKKFHHNKDKQPSKKKEVGEDGEDGGAEEEDDDDEDANLKEILKNYRDRAAERRTKADEPEMDPRMAGAYKAMPGDRRAAYDQTVRRRQAIEESKYLGGDMEHTHLVKGLDYSLLHKARAEITKTKVDVDDDEELEAALETRRRGPQEDDKQPESLMARNLQMILFKSDPPLRNEHFGKGRMAYVVELDDDAPEVPTTLLRSVHDCPVTESNAAVNANNMLIGKLTQVLSYLRADKQKKQKVRDAFGSEEQRTKAAEASIFDDAGDYAPKREREKEGGGGGGKRDYFGESGRKDDRDRDRDRRRDERKERDGRREEREREDREREKRRAEEKSREDLKKRFEEAKRLEEKLAKRKQDTDGYDECYPGGLDMGFGDSDDEEETGGPAAKKGRSAWGDEDGGEKFTKSSRNTEVKAAYQYGVKKGDGRKTGKAQDKKLDQDLDKINRIMEKRKTDGSRPDIKY